MKHEALMYHVLKIGMALAAFLPAFIGYRLSSAVGILLYYVLRSARRGVEANMRHVLGADVSPRRLAAVTRGVFRHAVKNYYDLLRLPKLNRGDIEKLVTMVGDEHIEAAFAKGRGVLVCGGHIGNFNLMMQIAAARNYKANIVAERLNSPKLDKLVSGLRERFGIKLIPTGPHVVRGIYRSLRANELLGLAIDRDITHSGLAVDLFGAPAVLPAGPVMLSLRLNAPLLPVRVRRDANNHTSVRIYPPVELERTGNNQRDVALGMEKMARLLEEFVRQAPEQWVVMQPLWAADGGAPLPSPGFAALSKVEIAATNGAAKLPAPEAEPSMAGDG